MAPNKTSRRVWQYETTPRTSALQNAADIAFDFGEYDDSILKWNVGAIENRILQSFVYNKRTPTLVDGRRKFNTFHEIFNPTTAQWLVWILGKCTDAGTDTIEPLDTGYQHPLTIRHEEGGGTETFEQAVSCWCVSAYCRAAAKEPVVVDLEFAFEQYQDHDDEPQLTSTIRSAGYTDTVGAYNGMPTVTYDPDSAATIIPQIVKAEFKIVQNYSATLNGSDTAQTIYKRTYEPVDLTLQAIMEVNTYWDEFMDRGTQDWEVAVYKPDPTYNIKMKFVNCKHMKTVKAGEAFKGFYTSTIHLQAEEVTATFVRDGSTTWADHFLGEVV